MTQPELDQLLGLLRKHGVVGFEGLDIKVTLDLTAAAIVDPMDPDKLGADPDEADERQVLFHSVSTSRKQ